MTSQVLQHAIQQLEQRSKIIDGYKKWLQKMSQRKHPRLLAYNCPECDFIIYTKYPTQSGETWDSLSICPSCGDVHWKETTIDSVVARKQ